MSRTLYFADGFLPFLQSGEKEITIRKGIRHFPLGVPIIARCEGQHLTITITACEHWEFHEIPLQDLIDDGFFSHKHALAGMRRFYRDLTEASAMTVIRFTLAEPVDHVILEE